MGLSRNIQGRAWSPLGRTAFSARLSKDPGRCPDTAPTLADLGSGAPSPDAPAARLPRRARGAPGRPSSAGRGRGRRPSRTRTGVPAPPARPPGPSVLSADGTRGRPRPRVWGVQVPVTPPLRAVCRCPGSGSTSDSAGRGGAEVALSCARALGQRALRVARAQRRGQEMREQRRGRGMGGGSGGARSRSSDA